MTLSPGDIVLVDVQFTDQSAVKQRPALVLRGADATGDFPVAPITSQPGHANTVELTGGDLAEGSLPKASWVRADRVFTINVSTVVRTYGAVRPTVLRAVAGILCPQLGCRA